MQRKLLLILPISIIGLLSCMPDSQPKTLSYDETLSYINKNYKEYSKNPTGAVEYTCENTISQRVISALINLGVKEGTISKAGSNDISSDNITNYINESNNETSLSTVQSLPLMYLSPTNFPIFANNGATYSYQLTYVNELIMSSTINTFSYKRYYNTSLHLTRFEVVDKEYTATQSFIY